MVRKNKNKNGKENCTAIEKNATLSADMFHQWEINLITGFDFIWSITNKIEKARGSLNTLIKTDRKKERK